MIAASSCISSSSENACLRARLVAKVARSQAIISAYTRLTFRASSRRLCIERSHTLPYVQALQLFERGRRDALSNTRNPGRKHIADHNVNNKYTIRTHKTRLRWRSTIADVRSLKVRRRRRRILQVSASQHSRSLVPIMAIMFKSS